MLMLKQMIALLFLFLMLLPASRTQAILPPSTMKRLQAVISAEKYQGVKYRKKIDNTIFDCSGFVKYVLGQVGVNITRSSVTIIHDGNRVKEKKEARPGDIIVFKGRNHRNKRPGHVGLIHHVAGDTIFFLHASTLRGVVLSHTFESYYAKRFLQIRDVIGD